MKKIIAAALLAFASVSAHASRFVVQIGTFDEQQAAQTWVPVLEKAGVPAYTEQRGDKTLLRAGPFHDRGQAAAALQKVRDAGLGGTDSTTPSVAAKGVSVAAKTAPVKSQEAAEACENNADKAQDIADAAARGTPQYVEAQRYGSPYDGDLRRMGYKTESGLVDSVYAKMNSGMMAGQVRKEYYDSCMSS
jgi:hypothetical protein